MFAHEGRGAMVRARSFAIVSPLNLGTLFRCCVLGQGTSSSNASLDSGEKEYLVGQSWQYVAEMAAELYTLHGVEMTHE